ncbi:hypothetical protein [Streptomyces sp. NBC_00878]|uniref:hypothetical protein n=1 Tax=Streptomyces sp. NBC_00878 TaxID=2975854 RepID=UPI00225625F8|nr:hypothetical protein [Streptomyces sp. NBC_00878]MCX4911867.1 hypothetical protein [Streptomyces sp. NBC_00878]
MTVALELKSLAPLARTIAETVQETPVRVGSAEGAADLVAQLTVNVAAYAGAQTLPLIDALRTVYASMEAARPDEWAMEWLGDVWSTLPLDVRAVAGDQDAAAELVALVPEPAR